MDFGGQMSWDSRMSPVPQLYCMWLNTLGQIYPWSAINTVESTLEKHILKLYVKKHCILSRHLRPGKIKDILSGQFSFGCGEQLLSHIGPVNLKQQRVKRYGGKIMAPCGIHANANHWLGYFSVFTHGFYPNFCSDYYSASVNTKVTFRPVSQGNLRPTFSAALQSSYMEIFHRIAQVEKDF